jgi:hypothetical protein
MNWKHKYDHGESMWEITTHVGRHPEPNVDYNHYVNKYLVKDVVRPIINVAKPFYYIRNMSEFADINFDDLPSKFIAKAAHGWNMQYISTGNKVADKERLETLCPLWLKRKFGHKKERHYRQVERGVVFEEYLGENLLEYKFLVIDHQIEEIEIEQCSSVKSFAPVDTDWKHRDGVCKQSGAWQFQPNLATEKPANLQELLKTVERLSRRIGDVLFVRIDIYDVDGVLYFGEYTFTPNAGKLDPCDYPSYDKYIGSLIDFKPAINDDVPEPAQEWL